MKLAKRFSEAKKKRGMVSNFKFDPNDPAGKFIVGYKELIDKTADKLLKKLLKKLHKMVKGIHENQS